MRKRRNEKVVALIMAALLCVGIFDQSSRVVLAEGNESVQVNENVGEKEEETVEDGEIEENKAEKQDENNVLNEGEVIPPNNSDEQIAEEKNNRDMETLQETTDEQELFGGGTGEENDPYVIASAEDLLKFAEVVNQNKEEYTTAYFILANDIYLNDITDYDTWEAMAPKVEWPGVKNFFGTFDGQQHTIYGVYMNSSSERVGFFSSLDVDTFDKSKITICDLDLKNSYIKGKGYVGGLIGYSDCNVEITNTSIEGIVSANSSYVGGIGGSFSSGGNKGLALTSVINRAQVSGSRIVGGIWGQASIGNSMGASTSGNGSEKITIRKCENYGDISSAGDYVGGIIGDLSRNLNCTGFDIGQLQNFGAVKGGNYAGGICGRIDTFSSESLAGDLSEASNTGNIKGGNYVGGIVGGITSDSKRFIVENAYNIGGVEGISEIGGIVGYSDTVWRGKVDVKGSFNKGKITAYQNNASIVGGLSHTLLEGTTNVSNCYYEIGSSDKDTCGSKSNVTELSKEDFINQSKFSGFNFETIWKMRKYGH